MMQLPMLAFVVCCDNRGTEVVALITGCFLSSCFHVRRCAPPPLPNPHLTHDVRFRIPSRGSHMLSSETFMRHSEAR